MALGLMVGEEDPPWKGVSKYGWRQEEGSQRLLEGLGLPRSGLQPHLAEQ